VENAYTTFMQTELPQYTPSGARPSILRPVLVFERQEIRNGEGLNANVINYEDRGYKWLSVIFQLPLGENARNIPR
jgi:hypothetical protein